MEMFEIGGCVRDEILGVRSKDIDFSVVLDDADLRSPGVNVDGFDIELDPYEIMRDRLRLMGFKIFLESPEFLTVRAQFPVGTGEFAIPNLAGGPANPGSKRLTADFVLARKESGYSDGRRPDSVEIGTLLDDQSRRDFTMNSIAKAADGSYIDPFNGQADIANRIIRAVGNPRERMLEDALRVVRALRFSVTKNFVVEGELWKVMQFDNEVLDAVAFNISDQRISDELSKMFRFDTMKSLHTLHAYPALTGAMFSGSISLDSTMKTKQRGK